ncbi:MAG: GtrA family protein [Acidocella sp.]|nr:GtrA family protein [Acidocella sp.]
MARGGVAEQVRDAARAFKAGLRGRADLLRFAAVGTIGLGWDTATVYATRGAIGLYAAGCAGFLVAASANWALNRVWTFRGRAHDAAHRQWLRFLAASLVGFVVNRGVFFALVAESATVRGQPIWGIAAGSLAGLGFNYFLSKRLVFR